MTVAERIMLVIEDQNMNMSQFAEALNVTPAYISKIKKHPETVPSDRFLKDICRTFHVNEDWLLSGEGNMHSPKTRAEEIGEIVQKMYDDGDPRYQLMRLVSYMTPKQLELVKEIAIKLADASENKENNDNSTLI